MITFEEAREYFDYKDGLLLWRKSKGSRAKKGREAGSTVDSRGYKSLGFNNRTYRVHRLVWLWHNGSFPAQELDHVDRDKSNNKIENLRESTRSNNMHNVGPRIHNSSGFKGIFYDSKNDNWRAAITVHYKKHNLGSYKTKEEAIAARKNYETLLR